MTNSLKIEENESGFFPLNNYNICTHPSHDPPSNLHIPQGKGYRHICPSCRKEVIIIPKQISKYRDPWV